MVRMTQDEVKAMTRGNRQSGKPRKKRQKVETYLGKFDSKTEANYAEELQRLLVCGEIVDWKHEPASFRLPGEKNTYRPDFMVKTLGGRIEIHEVKGHWRDDAKVKAKVFDGTWTTFFDFFVIKQDKGAFRKMPLNESLKAKKRKDPIR